MPHDNGLDDSTSGDGVADASSDDQTERDQVSEDPSDERSRVERFIEKRRRALRRVAFKHEADVTVLSGRLVRKHTDELINVVVDTSNKSDTIVLAVQTLGGEPAAGYQLTRVLKRHYERIVLLVLERCKSAGTLIALGADDIIMGPFAELGPLDVQRRKEGEIILRSSALDVQKSLHAINVYSLRFFRNSLAEILRMGGNAITTKRATDLASEMATGLLEPITSQIDPLRLGEDERKIEIARKYGKRLLPENRSEEIVLRFTDDYPSHGFVIDLTEAREIFGKDIVTSVGEEERSFENYWPSVRGELSEPFLDFHTLQSLTPIPPSSHAEATEQQQRQVSDEETPGDVEPDSTRQEQNAPADNIEPDSGDRDKTKREEQSPGERKSEPSVRRESDVEPSSAGEDDDQNGNNSTETEDE